MPTCDAYFVCCYVANVKKKNVFANRYRIFEGMGLQFSSVLRPQHNSTSEYQFATVLVQALIFICTMIKRKPLFLNFTGN